MQRAQKERVVADLSEKLAKAKSITFSDFKGLTVSEANELRAKCRETGVEYLVAKNTLIHLALPESLRDKVRPYLVGTTAVTLDYEEGTLGPKAISGFAKDHEVVKLKAGIFEEEVLDPVGIRAIADLPGREELYSKILGSIQSPATNLLRCVNGVGTKLAGLFRAYHEKLGNEAA